ncbi:MAG: MFS transporter [Anaerolineales bacterium]|nr:MFS transporter [Anaerolineales bacterium]
MFRNDALRALKHTDYRWYLTAAILSSIGTWMQTVALGWVTYELTHSPLLVGIVSVVPMLPVLPISFLAGVLTDRYAARFIIIGSNMLALAVAVSLTLLSWANGLDVWHLAILNFFLASAMVVDSTARKVFNSDLVGKEDVGSAVGLNTATNYVTLASSVPA